MTTEPKKIVIFVGQVLGSFFYGYILTQIPGGLLAQRIGGRWVFGVGVVMTAVLTILTPLAADISVWALVALRAMEGFFEVKVNLKRKLKLLS